MWNAKLEARVTQLRKRADNNYAARLKYHKRILRKAVVSAKKDVSRPKTPITDYPEKCPYCTGVRIVYYGSHDGKRRYRCKDCLKSFYDVGISVPKNWRLICHRCGGGRTSNRGIGAKGGRRGYCSSCKRGFTQGGRDELDRNGLLLKMRIDMISAPEDVKAEIAQQATFDVLEGRGYCWSIELDQRRAWKAARGDSWMGSSSAPYRLAIG